MPRLTFEQWMARIEKVTWTKFPYGTDEFGVESTTFRQWYDDGLSWQEGYNRMIKSVS